MKTEAPKPLLSVQIFALITILAVIFSCFILIISQILSRFMSPTWSNIVGFFLLTNYPACLVLTEYISLIHKGTSVRAALKAVREMDRSKGTIYFTALMPIIILAIGLGFAFQNAKLFPYLCLIVMLLFRFYVYRKLCEPYGIAHPSRAGMAERYTLFENFVSYTADIPWIVILVGGYYLTGIPLWALGACAVLSYSFLVRFDHGRNKRGPVTYVSILISLLIGSFFIFIFWLTQYDALRFIAGIATMSLGLSLQPAWAIVPMSKRIHAQVLFWFSIVLILYAYIYQKAIFFTDCEFISISSALFIPLWLHVLGIRIADARKWILSDSTTGP